MTSFLQHPVERAILRLFEDLATPISLKAAMLWRYGDWDQLASLEVDPHNYIDADRFWRDAMAISITRKLNELPTSFDRKAVAEEGFIKTELGCGRTNLRLLPYLSPGLPDTDQDVLAYIKRARKICKRILGPLPDTGDVYENPRTGTTGYVIRGRFGPGSTFGDKGVYTTIPDKMSSQPTLTSSAVTYLIPWVGTLWHKATVSAGKDPLFVRGNRFTTVPKDCKKDRGIAIEPSINLFYQLGYGRAIRARLLRAGINLVNGKELHMQVARGASITGALATLDLSSASDTICSNLVKLLLPEDWFSCLNDLRSHYTLFKGKWRLLEKFSSMGNGFTFELETLIFLCLILALDPTGQKLVVGDNVYVFGDDIIVPSENSQDVISALSFFGMVLNKSKSFVDGPFRESCGGDYFMGVDVRPHFMEDAPNEPQQLISLANGIRRASREAPDKRFPVLLRCWHTILDGLPSGIRSLRGPEALGDLVINDCETRWRTRHRSGIRYIRVFRPAKALNRVGWWGFAPDVTLASAVYGVPWGNGGIIPRDPVMGYKVGWVPFS